MCKLRDIQCKTTVLHVFTTERRRNDIDRQPSETVEPRHRRQADAARILTLVPQALRHQQRRYSKRRRTPLHPQRITSHVSNNSDDGKRNNSSTNSSDDNNDIQNIIIIISINNNSIEN